MTAKPSPVGTQVGIQPVQTLAEELWKAFWRASDCSYCEFKQPETEKRLTAFETAVLNRVCSDLEALANKWIRDASMLRWERGKSEASELPSLAATLGEHRTNP